MLSKLPKDLDLNEDKNKKKLGRFLDKYGMNPKDMRLIGGEYITLNYKPSERRKIRQYALRHKKLSTSLESYQMPVNTK